MARTGKIARLPLAIREELCQRLLAGQPAAKILPWLNGLEEVQLTLEADFEGLSVNDENLSKWRLGGYQEWLLRRDRVAHVKELSQLSVSLTKANGGTISEGAAAIAAGQILEVLEKLDEVMKFTEGDTPEETKSKLALIGGAVGDLTLAITRLRKGDHNVASLQLTRERLEQTQQALNLERQKFQRTTCELFLEWSASKRALEIADSPAPNSAKIEELGKLMFGDNWK